MSFEVWLCLIFVVIIKLWTFFFQVYDNLLLYHTDAFGKMISFILSLLFRLLSISGSCTFIILRVFLFFLKDPADKRRVICDDKLKELFEVDSFNGFTVSKLLSSHFIKTEQWVAYMYITWAHQKWEILLELNLPFSISLWQPVCSLLKKWK